jgi:hypothetical protein
MRPVFFGAVSLFLSKYNWKEAEGGRRRRRVSCLQARERSSKRKGGGERESGEQQRTEGRRIMIPIGSDPSPMKIQIIH